MIIQSIKQNIKEILKKKIFIHNEVANKSSAKSGAKSGAKGDSKINAKSSKKNAIRNAPKSEMKNSAKSGAKNKDQISSKKTQKNTTSKFTINENIDNKDIGNKNKDNKNNNSTIKNLTQRISKNSEKTENHQSKKAETAQKLKKMQTAQSNQLSQHTQATQSGRSIKSRLKSISRETLNELEKKILYSFKNKDLLIDALTHSSLNKMNGLKFERLEFLGDRILNLSIAKMLFLEYPDMNESQMTPKLSHMVCRDMLFEMSEKINLKLYARFKCQNEDKKILADMVEAIIGAIYMDDINHGTQNTEKFIYNYWYETINDELFNPRSELQEILHQHKLPNPIYDVYQVNDTFISKITIKADNNFDQENSSYIVASGEGKSIKAANKEAASEAIDQINKILKKK